MIDIHMHILPGIDDGSRSMGESIAMAVMAQESQITRIAATCHGNLGDLAIETYMQVFHELEMQLKKENITVELCTGMEVFMNDSALDKLGRGELLTLNQTRYVLVEFDFQEELWMVNDYLQMLEDAGYIPVIAHAERYSFVHRNIEEVYNWARRGFVIQVNKGSLLGFYGQRERDAALSLMCHNLVHVIATDAHGINRRTPRMRNASRFLSDFTHPAYVDLLLEENPRRILAGDEIASFPLKPYRRNIYW